MEKDTRIPNAAFFTVSKEDHTLANILRSKLLSNPKVLFAGYKVAHPLEPEFTLRLQTTSDTSPLEVLQEEINRLISELREAETEFEVEQRNFFFNPQLCVLISATERAQAS